LFQLVLSTFSYSLLQSLYLLYCYSACFDN
jgi:hypothetical protein